MDAITGWSTIALTALTAIYVWLTYRILRRNPNRASWSTSIKTNTIQRCWTL